VRGCVTHRADGTYAAVIELSRGPDGRRRHRWFGGYRTRKEAQAKLNELVAELQANTFVAPSKMRLAEFLRRWLAESAAHRLSGRSFERTQCIVERHLVPELGGYRLSELRPLHIQSYLSRARKGGRVNGSCETLAIDHLGQLRNRGVAKESHEGRVDRHQPAVHCRLEDADRRVVEDAAVASLALTQRPISALLVAQIPEPREHVEGRTVVIAQAGRRDEHGKAFATLAHERRLDPGGLSRELPAQRILHRVLFLGRPEGGGYATADELVVREPGHGAQGRVDVEEVAVRADERQAVRQVLNEAVDHALTRLRAACEQAAEVFLGTPELGEKSLARKPPSRQPHHHAPTHRPYPDYSVVFCHELAFLTATRGAW
jgi:hypothetical protein